MGHANSKLRAEVEQIVSEVRDLQAYIIRNFQDLDDEHRNDLHRRLINYSESLERISKSTKERHSKDLKESIRFVNKVIEELLVGETQTKNLDLAAVETNSFIHVPGKNTNFGSVESLSKKQTKVKKDVIMDKYRLPSLEEIKDKTASLKPEVENAILMEDVNQMLVQQKIIQILATDLEMIVFEPHSPLQETKSTLEKELSSLYRKLEKYKNKLQRRHSEAAQFNQKKQVRTCLDSIADISKKADQIMCHAHVLIREKKFEEIGDVKEQLQICQTEIENMSILSEEVAKQRNEVLQKITKIVDYVNKEVGSYEVNKKQNFDDEIAKIEILSDKYKRDIEKSNDGSNHDWIKRNLLDLEDALSKIESYDENSRVRKDRCKEKIQYMRQLNEEKLMKNHLKQFFDDTKEMSNEKQGRDQNGQASKDEGEEVVLRRKIKADKPPEENRTIDGFYSYWKHLQSNLPARNCSLEELRQIALLLQDIEDQIHAKRTKIQNFLKLKEAGKPLTYIEKMNYEEYLNKSLSNINQAIIDDIDGGAIKTNAKIYRLNETKSLVIDDDEIIQNVEEINKNIKKINKEKAEKILIPPDSTSESSEAEAAGSKTSDVQGNKNETKAGDAAPKPRVEATKIVNKRDSSQKERLGETKVIATQDLNSTNHIEAITQIQNIIRNVEYLKEKAKTFEGTKQTPKYADIKSRLDSYRKTLNILISYQNESITLSCNRVLESIDEVVDILNTNTEKQNSGLAANLTKRNTVDTLFVEMVEIETTVEDLSKKINNFTGASENDEYHELKQTLLNNKESLDNIHVSSNYENIINFRKKVKSQIDDLLYNLDLKLEENKAKSNNTRYEEDRNKKKILSDFQKIKEKISRFSGSYKNVLYKQIEKSAERCLSMAHDLSNDEKFLNSLQEEIEHNLKILEEKSTKESNYGTNEVGAGTFIDHDSKNFREDVVNDNAIRLSRIRQNFKDIKDEINSKGKLTLEVNKQLEHRINLNILELSSINIGLNEPFYYDKETLRSEFSKLLEIVKENISAIEGENITNNAENRKDAHMINTKVDSLGRQLSKIEESLKSIKKDIDAFSGERNTNRFFDIDEMLTRLSMTVEKLPIKKGDTSYKNKLALLKNIYQCSEILESKAQSYEILQNIEKRITEVTYRVNNFEDLSGGDYNALYRELTDLETTLKDLDVGEDIRDKKLACQRNIQRCLGLIEERISNRDNYDGVSDDGTLV